MACPPSAQLLPPWQVPNSCRPRMSKHVKIVMFGHSYLFVTISRASAAQSSPLKNAGVVLSFGCVEKRAEIAHTARIKTGGTVPALWIRLALVRRSEKAMYSLQLPHKAWFMQQMISLTVYVFKKYLREMFLDFLGW